MLERKLASCCNWCLDWNAGIITIALLRQGNSGPGLVTTRAGTRITAETLARPTKYLHRCKTNLHLASVRMRRGGASGSGRDELRITRTGFIHQSQ